MEFIVRDGVRLAYSEAGRGDPPILLVHGMQCDHTHMAPLFEHLAQKHRVISIDLRGHGESDKPVGDYSNRTFNDDIAFVCSTLGIIRPVAIGHSFGGSTLLALAVRDPDLLGGIVLLDSGVRGLAAKAAELGTAHGTEAASDNAEQSRNFLASRLFGPNDPSDLKARILDQMESVPQHVVEPMREAVLGFDAATAALACAIPSLFILANNPFTDAETVAGLGANWRIGKVVGAGHFVQLVVPDQVNAMIDRFIALLPRN